MQYTSFKGSRIDFSNIVFTRRFHPPLRAVKSNVEAEYDYENKQITIFLAGLKKLGYNADKKVTHKEIVRLIEHEVLHGVIGYIMDEDGLDIYSYNVHFPHENGVGLGLFLLKLSTN